VVRAVVLKRNQRRAEPPPPPDPLSWMVDPRPAAPLPSWRERAGRVLRVYSLFLVFVPLGALLCAIISERLAVLQVARELAAASRIQDKLLQENRELRVEAASLRSPPRVAEVAAREFEMRVPEPNRVVVLDGAGDEILPLPPAPEVSELPGGHLVE
jgi:cell division protein FtsL